MIKKLKYCWLVLIGKAQVPKAQAPPASIQPSEAKAVNPTVSEDLSKLLANVLKDKDTRKVLLGFGVVICVLAIAQSISND